MFFFVNHNNNKILKSDWLSTVLILGSYLSNWTAPSLALEWFFWLLFFLLLLLLFVCCCFCFSLLAKSLGISCVYFYKKVKNIYEFCYTDD